MFLSQHLGEALNSNQALILMRASHRRDAAPWQRKERFIAQQFISEKLKMSRAIVNCSGGVGSSRPGLTSARGNLRAEEPRERGTIYNEIISSLRQV